MFDRRHSQTIGSRPALRQAGGGGFSIVELLIIVVVIALIATILLPMYLNSLQVSKQKRTMSDMTQVGTALMSWVSDQVGAAAAGVTTGDVDMSDYGSALDQETLETMLVPQYLQSLPQYDAWGSTMEYRVNVGNLAADELMAIRSPGGDRAFSGDTYTAGAFDPRSYNEDLVWVDGIFVRWPQKE